MLVDEGYLSGRIAVGWVEWCRGIRGIGSESVEVCVMANSGLNARVTYAAVNYMV